MARVGLAAAAGAARLALAHRRGFASAGGGAGPLAGVKVLDLGQMVAGGYCSAVLGYFGADVVKIEPPGAGDPLRSLRALDETGTSLWWRSYGRNKRCVSIDLRTEKGRGLVKRLAKEWAEVLCENFRPGVMEKWGLGPEDLPERLVYARISGYGQTGPLAREPGYASVCEAYSGFRSLNGYADRPPVRPNISLGDTLAGLHSAFGVVMSLLAKQRAGGGGGGRHVVDVSITEAMFTVLEGCMTEAAYNGKDREPSGSTISGVVPTGTFLCADGQYAVVGGNGDSIYSRLMAAIGHADKAADNPLYKDNAARMLREDEIMGAIAAWCAERPAAEVLKAMSEARVPAGPVLRPTDLLQNEQLIARGALEEVDGFTLPAIHPRVSGAGTRWAGRAVGADTDEVLEGLLSLSQAELAELRQEGVI